MENDLRNIALRNLAELTLNDYPGRGILVGMDENAENVVQIYWLMGRSPGSRNRIFIDKGGGRLETEVADQSKKPGDTSLIIYCAMKESAGLYAVSNGHQTKNIAEEGLYHHLRKWFYEPDGPNFTPRISSVFDLDSKSMSISIIKKSLIGDGCRRQLFCYDDLIAGYGHCVTTYDYDGDPLPSFSGEPYLLPIMGGVEEVANVIWEKLDDDNRVALAAKAINLVTGESTIHIINKYNG